MLSNAKMEMYLAKAKKTEDLDIPTTLVIDIVLSLTFLCAA
jgi:hypothetical protein